MKPGATIRSDASMVRFADSVIFPISSILPFAIATSARTRAAPVPSTTVPFFISRSYDIRFPRELVQVHPIEFRCVVTGHLARDVVGNSLEVFRDHLERVGPGGIGMRK